MSWSSNQFAAALIEEWRSKAPASTEHRRHATVEPLDAMPASGIAHRDLRRHSLAGASERADSSVVIQEVGDFFKAWSASVSDTDGESFESYLAVSTGAWWWGTFEIVSNPAANAGVTLKWLQPTVGQHLQSATRTVVVGANVTATAVAILAQLELIKHVGSATKYVVNGKSSMFHAWITNGGSANKKTVVIAASSSRQGFAEISTTFAAAKVLPTYASGTSAGAILTNRLRDLRHPWTTAMVNAEIATANLTNKAGGTTAVVPTREDLDAQGVLLRSSTGASMTTGGKVAHPEVIAAAVPRTVVLELNYTDFAAAAGTLVRTVALPFPFTDRLDFDYFVEGPVIITDAFIENHTSWQVNTAGQHSGTYPSVTLDVGITNPVLEDAGTERLSRSAILRRQRVTTNVTIGMPVEAGMSGLNTGYHGAETYHGACDSVLTNGQTAYIQFGETDSYPTTDYHAGAGDIPRYITIPQDFVMTEITFELPSSTAYTYAAAHHVKFKILVCPPSTSPQVASFVSIGDYIDLSAEPFNTAFSTTGEYKPASAAASVAVTERIGAMIGAGWKVAILATAVGTVTTRGWTVRVHGYYHGAKGAALAGGDSVIVDPWSGRSDTLTLTAQFEQKTELLATAEPGTAVYDLAQLDQGKCYLHIRYWQPRRVAAAQAAATP